MKDRVKALFVLLCAVAFVGAIAFVHINLAIADEYKINGYLQLVGWLCVVLCAYLVYKLIGTNKSDA